MAKKILVASGKGGTGKSMFCVNMAWTLASRGYRVLLLDADYGHGSLDLYMGVQDSCIYNTADVMLRTCDLDQAVISTDEPRLKLMPASPDEDEVTLDAEIFGTLDNSFEYIIIDGPAGMDRAISLAGIVNRTVIVSTCENASVRAADRFDMKARHEGIRNRVVVLNKVKPDLMEKGGCLSFEEIKEMMKTTVIGIIPWDEEIEYSLNAGRAAVSGGNSLINDNFRKICERIINRKI